MPEKAQHAVRLYRSARDAAKNLMTGVQVPARVVYSPAVVPSLWVAQLIVSEMTAHKLAVRHGLDWQEVRDALVCTRGLRYGWDDDPVRGRRALVEVGVHGISCIAVLYPVDDRFEDVYALGSAYPR